MSSPFFYVVAGIFGLLIGSFLNVCILSWGVEPKESVLRPRSRCPKCGHQIAWYDNIPVLSWLILAGKCRHCRQSIALMYPLVELATCIIWIYFVWLFGPTLAAVRAAIFFTLLLGIAITDARAFVIPHEFSIGGAALVLVLQFGMGAEVVVPAVGGALFGAGLLLLVGEIGSIVLHREAMGGGDMALMGLVGACLGWQGVLLVLFLGCIVGIALHLLGMWLSKPLPGHQEPDEQPASPRWHLVPVLLAACVGIVAVPAILARYGLLGEVLIALGWGICAAGAAYYVQVLTIVPKWLGNSRWAGVTGIIAASLAFATLPHPGALRFAITLAVLAMVYALVVSGRRVDPAPDVGITKELEAAGYLPFGVSLSIAAGVLVLHQGSVAPSQLLTAYFSSIGA